MKTILAVAGAALLLDAPAFADDAYRPSPALSLADRVPSQDTGSAQVPHFDGQSASVTTQDWVINPNASEGSVESANSGTAALGRSPNSTLVPR